MAQRQVMTGMSEPPAIGRNASLYSPNSMIDANSIHKALANPLRREILGWLKHPAASFPAGYADFGRGVPANAIQARAGLAQSTMSTHIAALVEARLLVSTRVGQWIFLSRNEEVIRSFTDQLSRHL
jgi:DNA-binding transcriptional ArsR family regulator